MRTACKFMSKFYSVRVGKAPGIYNSWEEAKVNVVGYKGAIHKAFSTLTEAQIFLGDVKNSVLTSKNMIPKHRSDEKMTDSHYSDDCIVLYTDGSFRNSPPAGWGVVVLNCSSLDSRYHISAELFGRVIIDSSSPFFLGATRASNNTGELTALGEALLWLRDHDKSTGKAIIRYDSEYAANSVQGFYAQATKNLALIGTIKGILRQVRSHRQITFEHVKAHSSDKWNDKADALANMGRHSTSTVGRYSVTNDDVPVIKSSDTELASSLPPGHEIEPTDDTPPRKSRRISSPEDTLETNKFIVETSSNPNEVLS